MESTIARAAETLNRVPGGPRDSGVGGTASIDPADHDLIDVVIWMERSINRLTALRASAIELARRQALGPSTAASPTDGSSTDASSTGASSTGASPDDGPPAGGSPGTDTMRQRAFVAEIAAALTVSERAAENLIGTARVLTEQLPGTLRALAEGRIGYRHAQIMVDHAAGLDDEDAVALEEAVLPEAGGSAPPRFDRQVRAARERLNPDTIEERHRRAADERDVRLDPGRDGMAWLTAHLPAAQAVAIFDRLTTASRVRIDARTLGQRRADLFAAALLAGSATAGSATAGSPTAGSATAGSATAEARATGPGAEGTTAARSGSEGRAIAGHPSELERYSAIRPTVVVTVPALTLLGRVDEPATLEGYGPIDPETARILAAGAGSFIRLLTHPETGAALSVGRRRYKVPEDLRAWLRIRDSTCRFIGCGRSAAHCDIDHSRDWQHGGPTDHDNLAHLCRRHHRLKGETDWTLTQRGDGSGVLRWTSPGGREYITRPATELRAVPG